MQYCDEYSNYFIKNLIYKEKVVIFGKENCEYTKKAQIFFYETFKHKSKIVNLDTLDIPEHRINKIAECLYLRTKDKIIPKIYLNGMYLGNYNVLSDKQYTKEFDIYFI